MKRAIVATAVAFLFSNGAFAQSSVTLYGLIDEGFDFTSNAAGNRGYQMVSGNTAGSRWGLKGSEDLGGGTSAIFQLENGFDVNSGALGGGREFGRQAFVGLSSRQWGVLTFGRQYDPAIDMWSSFTATGNMIGDIASHPYNNDNADYSWHINNSVKYVSPSYKGLKGEVIYGFSNQAGGFANNRMYGAAGTYTAGPFSAALAYTKMNSPGANTGGALVDQVFTAGSQQNVDAGVKWTFANNANVGFAYSHTDVYGPTSNSFLTNVGTQTWNAWKFDNYEVNGQYFFRPDLSLTGSYTYTHANLHATSGKFSPAWHQVALMLNYSISKRTSVYVEAGYQHAMGGHTNSDFDKASIVYSPAASSTVNQEVTRVGIMHQF